MNYYRCEVIPKTQSLNLDSLEKSLWDSEDKHFLISQSRAVYLIESERVIAVEHLREVFEDPLLNYVSMSFSHAPEETSHAVEVLHKPGVTDNPGLIAEEALSLLGIEARVASGTLYFVNTHEEGDFVRAIAEEYLGNPLIHTLMVSAITENLIRERFDSIRLPKVVLHHDKTLFKTISLDRSDEGLRQLSQERCLALTVEELRFAADQYHNEGFQRARSALGLPKDITDVELEILAQTWSEHCKHKIFSAHIDYIESEGDASWHRLGSFAIQGLYPEYIKGTTRQLQAEGVDWAVSVFSDNAGVVDFDDAINCCIKVETHNSPSALDPYGGALTGILGVNRDILGCGMGAKPVANTNVLCFADPYWSDKDALPAGPKSPKQMFKGVHAGIEAGGNKSGIPTVNGAFYFDPDYAGKPLVYCGTVGVMPKRLPNGVEGHAKPVQKGDRVFMVGGAIGADGIHGATFSSMELDETAPATAVQIGDPLVQKRMSDFILEARDKGLFSGLTDNGAGGLSSSVGELATLTGGARIDLATCPTKYPGLAPWELMVSESQERMTVAVPPDKSDAFRKLASKHGVSATDIGGFDNSGFLTVYYEDSCVANLDLAFMHDALPPMQLKAHWNGPRERPQWKESDSELVRIFPLSGGESIEVMLKSVMARPNVASKASWVRRYDHEVQGATLLKPFEGRDPLSPNDAGVIWLYPHGGSERRGVAIGCGINPRMSLVDPYLMALAAVDEAIRNVVATGANPDRICLLDNFCWPDPVASLNNPEGTYRLGQLVRTCAGLKDAALAYRAPIVSGKDSMKNNFKGKNRRGETISFGVLPTLLVTAMGAIEIPHITDASFKKVGDVVYILGQSGAGLAGSEFAECVPLRDPTSIRIDLELNAKTYRSLHALISQGLVSTCHDISEGGLLAALAEACFAENVGISVKRSLYAQDRFDFLFSESGGRFIVGVPRESVQAFESHLGDTPFERLGEVNDSARIDWASVGLDVSVNELYEIWSKALEEI